MMPTYKPLEWSMMEGSGGRTLSVSAPGIGFFLIAQAPGRHANLHSGYRSHWDAFYNGCMEIYHGDTFEEVKEKVAAWYFVVWQGVQEER